MQTSFSINIMRHYTLWAIVRGFSNPYISGSRGKDLLIFFQQLLLKLAIQQWRLSVSTQGSCLHNRRNYYQVARVHHAVGTYTLTVLLN